MTAGLPQFSYSKFHKHSMACGDHVDCRQVPFSKMAVLMVKADMISDCKPIFSHLVAIMLYVELVVHLFK